LAVVTAEVVEVKSVEMEKLCETKEMELLLFDSFHSKGQYNVYYKG
jgi:hypothetical protein